MGYMYSCAAVELDKVSTSHSPWAAENFIFFNSSPWASCCIEWLKI